MIIVYVTIFSFIYFFTTPEAAKLKSLSCLKRKMLLNM